MKNTANATSGREMPIEDRHFYFGLTAATLLSVVIAIIAGELI
jgi:hypothetical protein